MFIRDDEDFFTTQQLSLLVIDLLKDFVVTPAQKKIKRFIKTPAREASLDDVVAAINRLQPRPVAA